MSSLIITLPQTDTLVPTLLEAETDCSWPFHNLEALSPFLLLLPLPLPTKVTTDAIICCSYRGAEASDHCLPKAYSLSILTFFKVLFSICCGPGTVIERDGVFTLCFQFSYDMGSSYASTKYGGGQKNSCLFPLPPPFQSLSLAVNY